MFHKEIDVDEDESGPPVAHTVAVMDNEDTPTQYTKHKGGYLVTSKTFKELPAGFYNPNNHYENNKSWNSFDPMNIVNDNIIKFDDPEINSVIEEINNFWGSKEEYSKLGFSHKRSYLFYGNPGTGKTLIIRTIAQQAINNGNVVFFVDDLRNFERLLPEFRKVEPDRKLIVVIEDIDNVVSDRGDTNLLLQILDGEKQVDNVLFLTTSNYPDVMEKRFINRPGRIDRLVKVDVPEDSIRRQYIVAKLGTDTIDGVNLVEITKGLSLGHMREFVVEIVINRKNPKEVAERLLKMRATPKAGPESSIGFAKSVEDD